MRFLTIDQAAEQLELSAQSVRRLCAVGEIAGATKHGHAWVVPDPAKRIPSGKRRGRQPKAPA